MRHGARGKQMSNKLFLALFSVTVAAAWEEHWPQVSPAPSFVPGAARRRLTLPLSTSRNPVTQRAVVRLLQMLCASASFSASAASASFSSWPLDEGGALDGHQAFGQAFGALGAAEGAEPVCSGKEGTELLCMLRAARLLQLPHQVLASENM